MILNKFFEIETIKFIFGQKIYIGKKIIIQDRSSKIVKMFINKNDFKSLRVIIEENRRRFMHDFMLENSKGAILRYRNQWRC